MTAGNNHTDWQQATRDLVAFLSEACAPPSSEPTEAWAEKWVVVPDGPFAGSRWRLAFTPMAKWIFASQRNPRKKRITIMMCAQLLKTTSLLIMFLRNAKEDPASSMWVMAEADHMGEFVTKRLLPYIENCPLVAPLLIGSKKGLIQLETMNLMLRGSNSRAKLQSDPVRYVYCDERREWKPGSIDILRKRMRTFPNAMEISAGTAGKENDELHSDYREGSQTRAHINCLLCGHSQPIRFGREVTSLWPQARECGGFVWEKNETTKPNGVWNYPEVKKTVRFECENPQCRAHFTNQQKYELLRTMHPHNYNPNAPEEYDSFSASAFEAVWESCDWDKLVEEFLKAVEAARKGNLEPLKTFITETLGEPWQEQLGVIEEFGFLEARKQPYEFGEAWAEERVRFMAADRGQAGGEHYWWLVRAYGSFGKSRLIAHGRCNTKAELEEIRKQYGVRLANAMVDTGFKAQELYAFCLSTGWKAFKGDNVEYYLHRIQTKTGPKTIRVIWDKTTAIATAPDGRKMGQVDLFRYADEPTKDVLMDYMSGVQGEWSVPEKCGRELFKHYSSEVRREETDARGRVVSRWYQVRPENHWKDCEKIIHVAAIITKFVAGTTRPKMTVTVDEPSPAASATAPSQGGKTLTALANVRASMNGSGQKHVNAGADTSGDQKG